VALKAPDMIALEYKAARLVAYPGELRRLRDNMRGLGRPGAAAEVLNRLLDGAR
jgi:hypothetical protein